jgi:hypothetical protein
MLLHTFTFSLCCMYVKASTVQSIYIGDLIDLHVSRAPRQYKLVFWHAICIKSENKFMDY